MATGVTDIDRGWRKLFARLRRTPKVVARVGVQAPEAEADRGDGLTNAQLANIHEFGAPSAGIPERSFMRSTFDENQKKYQHEADRIANAALEGNALEGEMLLLGEQYRADVLAKVKAHVPPPLADETVERKRGETTPLIDTGQLINAIRVEVTKP